MSLRHFIDSEWVSELVPDSLESLVYQHPDLVFDKKQKTVFRHGKGTPNDVTLISGGGAGHEPAHAMFVGEGMLAAAVSGNIFASPSVPQIYACIKRVAGPSGAILIVKNYTGDVFHFHQAAEKARANLSLRVEVLVVGDDVSVGRAKSGKVGRRGLAGTVLVHKILGAAVASMPETSLNAILSLGKKVTSGLVTVAASLDHVHIPGQPLATVQRLDAQEIELGMGIHNEPGVRRLRQPPLNVLLETMISYLLDQDEDRSYVNFDRAENIVLMVNNLGSLSVLELGAITTHVLRKLAARKIIPNRVYSGTFMTSLDGPGFSITLLRADLEMIQLLDKPTTALGWKAPGLSQKAPSPNVLEEIIVEDDIEEVKDGQGPQLSLEKFKAAVVQICQKAINEEPTITHFDTIVGDGDCGTTLKRGAQAVLSYIDGSQSTSALKHLLEIARLVEENMDGTSGAIYALFFNGLCSSVRELPASITSMGQTEWIIAAENGLQVVQKPFVLALKSGLDQAVDASVKGIESTKGMTPAFGRAVYVNEAGWDAVPDPGAASIVALVQGLREGLKM